MYMYLMQDDLVHGLCNTEAKTERSDLDEISQARSALAPGQSDTEHTIVLVPYRTLASSPASLAPLVAVSTVMPKRLQTRTNHA